MFANLILLAQEKTGPEGGILSQLGPFLPLIVIMFAFYFLLVLPKKRQEKKEREDLFTRLKKNDEVVTYSGIIGIVASFNKDSDEVVLKVDESSNVRLRVLKSTILRINSPKDAGKDGAAAAAANDNIKAGSQPAK